MRLAVNDQNDQPPPFIDDGTRRSKHQVIGRVRFGGRPMTSPPTATTPPTARRTPPDPPKLGVRQRPAPPVRPTENSAHTKTRQLSATHDPTKQFHGIALARRQTHRRAGSPREPSGTAVAKLRFAVGRNGKDHGADYIDATGLAASRGLRPVPHQGHARREDTGNGANVRRDHAHKSRETSRTSAATNAMRTGRGLALSSRCSAGALAAPAMPSPLPGGLWCSTRAVLTPAGSRSTDGSSGSARRVEPRRSPRPGSYRCLVLPPTRGSSERRSAARGRPPNEFGHVVGCEDAERAVTVGERDQRDRCQRKPDYQRKALPIGPLASEVPFVLPVLAIAILHS